MSRISAAPSTTGRKKAVLGFIPLGGPLLSLLRNVEEAWKIQRVAEKVIKSS